MLGFFPLPRLLDYIIRSCRLRSRLFPYLWRRKHNLGPAGCVGCLLPRLIMPPERLAPRLVFRLVPRSVLLACLIFPRCLIGSLSSARLSLGGLLSSRRLIGSPLPRIARLPAPFDKRDGAARSAGAHRRAGGGCLLASDGGGRMAANGWRRLLACLGRQWAAGGHRRRMAAGGGRWRGFLLASGRGTERLDRSSIVPLSLSSSHPIDEAPAPFIISSSHRRGGTFFPFSPDPLPPALLGLLARGLFPRPRPGDVRTCVMACGGGRGGCLFAFSYPVPLSRCCSFARCYMTCVARAARSFLGRRWAFYGLF